MPTFFGRIRARLKLGTRLSTLVFTLFRARAVGQELRLLPDHASPADFVNLRRQWGNPSAADENYLAELWRLVHHRKRVLECGSGLTTLVIAEAARRVAGDWLSLDQSAYWARINRRRLRAVGVPYDAIVYSPLKGFGEFDWYSIGMHELERLSPSLVVCDGPPAGTRGGRYGVLRRLGAAASGAIVLVDDLHRSADRETVERWKAEYGATVQQVLESGFKTYAIVSVPEMKQETR